MKHPQLIQFMAIAAFAMVLSGCSRAVAPSLPTQETTDPVETMETILPVSPMPESGGKLIACNTDADCIPNPSECHTHSCVTKTAAEGMEKVEICTMMFDYQAAYSPEDCSCQLGKCVNKNLGRTGDAPSIQ